MLRARNRFADSVRRLYGLRRRFPQVALFACLAAMAGIAGYGRAEDEILKLVPEQALGFVVVSRPAAADAKLQQLGREMKLPIPSLLAKLEGPGGIRAGLDKKRPIALLVLPPKDKGIPAAIVLVPVSDYAKFLEQFKSDDTEAGVTKIELWGSASLVRKVGSYAAISGPPVSREALQDVKLADEVPAGLAPWRTWLAKEDAAAVILAPGIRSLSDKVQQGINAVKPVLAQGGDQMKQAAAALDMYVMFFQTAEKEVASFGLGVERDAQGVVRLTKRIRLVAGGKWASFVADVKPSKQDALAGLPDEPFVVAAGGPLSEAAMRKLMDASFALIKSLRGMYGLSEEQAQAISELGREKFPGIRGVSFVLGAGQGSETMFARMLGVMRVDNSETFLADYEKYLARYNRVVEKFKSPMFQPMQCEKTEMGGALRTEDHHESAADAQYAARECQVDRENVRARWQDRGLDRALQRGHRGLQLHGPRAPAEGDRGDQAGQARSGGQCRGCQGCRTAAARRDVVPLLQPQRDVRFSQARWPWPCLPAAR